MSVASADELARLRRAMGTRQLTTALHVPRCPISVSSSVLSGREQDRIRPAQAPTCPVQLCPDRIQKPSVVVRRVKGFCCLQDGAGQDATGQTGRIELLLRDSPRPHQRASWPNHRPGAGHAGRARAQVAWIVSGRRYDGPALPRSFNCRIAMPTLMGRCLWPWPAQR